jgi:hypothetical protein
MLAFGPYRAGGRGIAAGQLSQLRCMHTHVQAAVDGGLPGAVVAALEALFNAGS